MPARKSTRPLQLYSIFMSLLGTAIMASALMFGALMVTACTKSSGYDTTSSPRSKPPPRGSFDGR